MEGKFFRIHGPESSWSDMVYTLNFLYSFSASAALFVFFIFHNACANVLGPPQTETHNGRSSCFPSTFMIQSEPSESFLSPTPCMPYTANPFFTTGFNTS